MAVNRYFLDLSDRLVEMTDTMAMLASHNEQLLQFVGLIATAQPMLLDSWHAEQLLLQIGHPEYTHACQECHGVEDHV